VPHGISVVVTAAASFDYTYAGSPGRHDRVVELLTQGDGVDGPPAEALGTWLRRLLLETDGPRGLDDFGYTPTDVPQLAERTLTQHRLLVGAPRPVDAESVSGILHASFSQ
jgi:hydroxyacid-oxoacid transhydrogenase